MPKWFKNGREKEMCKWLLLSYHIFSFVEFIIFGSISLFYHWWCLWFPSLHPVWEGWLVHSLRLRWYVLIHLQIYKFHHSWSDQAGLKNTQSHDGLTLHAPKVTHPLLKVQDSWNKLQCILKVDNLINYQPFRNKILNLSLTKCNV